MNFESQWRVCKGVQACGVLFSASATKIERLADNENLDVDLRNLLRPALVHLWAGVAEVRYLQQDLKQFVHSCARQQPARVSGASLSCGHKPQRGGCACSLCIPSRIARSAATILACFYECRSGEGLTQGGIAMRSRPRDHTCGMHSSLHPAQRTCQQSSPLYDVTGTVWRDHSDHCADRPAHLKWGHSAQMLGAFDLCPGMHPAGPGHLAIQPLCPTVWTMILSVPERLRCASKGGGAPRQGTMRPGLTRAHVARPPTYHMGTAETGLTTATAGGYRLLEQRRQ